MTITPTSPSRDRFLRELNETLFQLMWRYSQEVEQLSAPMGINGLRAFMLDLVAREPVHPSTLAQRLDLAPSAVSHLLKELEGRGLLERSHDSSDRRRVHLALTKKGAKVLEEIHEGWKQFVVEKLSVLNEEEILTLHRLHQKLLAAT